MIPSLKQWKQWSLPSKLTAVGAYVGVLSIIITGALYLLAPSKDKAAKNLRITYGDQSPIIEASGDVNVTYGVPQQLVNRWAATLGQLQLSTEQQNQEIRRLGSAFQNFEMQLASQSESNKGVQEFILQLDKGDLEEAAKISLQYLDEHIQRQEFQEAADWAENMSAIRKFQILGDQAASFKRLSEKLRHAGASSFDRSIEVTNSDNNALPDHVVINAHTKSYAPFPSVYFGHICSRSTSDDIISQFAREEYSSHPMMIAEPVNNDAVPFLACITGIVRDPDSVVRVLVSAKGAPEWWWQDQVGIDPTSGIWVGRIYIGRPGNLDSDREYKIVVLVDPDKNTTKLSTGEWVGSLPPARYVSKPITVVRE